MDNGQMARWVAQVEHLERMQVQKRDEQMWRDIRPDDLDTRVMHPAVASHFQPAGDALLFLRKRFASLRARLGIERKSVLAHTKVGYKQSRV